MPQWLCLLAVALCLSTAVMAKDQELLNVSYDPTREFYEEYNQLFADMWKQKTGDAVRIRQSHGGSGKQARSVVEGLRADVVTLALAYDIDAIATHSKRLPPDWQQHLPENSTPYTSTIVLMVRKGNPKAIHDWDDLVRPGIRVITPNPKTSGGARWNYLAVWGYAMKRYADDEAKAMAFMQRLFANVPVLDAGARAATTSFAQRGMGDVLMTWENEAFLAQEEFGKDKLEIITPSQSILAEPPVAVVTRNTNKKGTTEVATAYLEHLFSAPAQHLAAKHHFRPRDAAIAAEYSQKFPTIPMQTIADFGGWQQVQKKHFDDGGIFDQIYGK